MTKKLPYTFTVLRYVHDITTGEFINVGVVLYSPKARVLKARMRTTYGRLRKVFPGANGEAFKRTMSYVEQSIGVAGERLGGLFPDPAKSAVEFAARVLPKDDSSLQWSPLGSGQAEDMEKEADCLFHRMVMEHEHRVESRNEEDVWRSFSRALEKRNLLTHLHYKEIVAKADSLAFDHAWKNGIWHCLEPVSFDLADGERIRTKALRWVGQMTALQDSPERFKLYLLIGEPRRENVLPQYHRAMRILETMPGDKAIYTEAQADQLSEVIARQVAHA